MCGCYAIAERFRWTIEGSEEGIWGLGCVEIEPRVVGALI